MKLKLRILILVLFAGFGVAFAQAPQGMNYQAVARNSSGNALVNHTVGIQITIIDTVGNTTLYREHFTKTTNEFGLFTLNIGSGTVDLGTFATINWAGITPWLRVEMDPNGGTSYSNMGTSQLLSTPYALYAKSAGGNQWTTNGNNIYNNNSANVGIGTVTPTLGKLQVTPASAQTGIYAQSVGAVAVEGVDSTGIGVVGVSKAEAGVVGEATGNGYGVYATSATGDAVYATSSYLGLFVSGGIAGSVSISEGAGGNITSYYGTSFNEDAGLFASGNSTSGATGFSYGVVGEATSNNVYNAGVFGYASGSRGSGARNWGVYGLSDDSIIAVGIEAIGTGVATSYGAGAYATSGTLQIGIYGYAATSSASNYAGYFLGPIYASSASSGIKTFKIDHPSDPANKFLYHSSVESNDMMDLYNGNITTDANGEAVVTLPSYFEVLNKDFKYQLTCIGQFAQAIVLNEITNNQFTIKTDKPNVKVSWTVAGVRHDPVAEKYRVVNEVEKNALEKGKYLNPDVYGMPASAGMNLPLLPEKAQGSGNLSNHGRSLIQTPAIPKVLKQGQAQ